MPKLAGRSQPPNRGTSWKNSIMLSKQMRLDMKQEGHMDLNEYVNIFYLKISSDNSFTYIINF
jgi:hypothetical protein